MTFGCAPVILTREGHRHSLNQVLIEYLDTGQMKVWEKAVLSIVCSSQKAEQKHSFPLY